MKQVARARSSSPCSGFMSFTILLLITCLLAQCDGSTSAAPSSQWSQTLSSTLSSIMLRPHAAALEHAFPVNTQSLYKIQTINGLSISGSFSLLQQVVSLFQFSYPEVHFSIASYASNDPVRALYATGTYDFAATHSNVAATDLSANPSLMQLPLHTNAVVITYNLPNSVSQGDTLILSAATMCGVMRGAILYWDDAAIQADNPSMQLTHQRIQVLLRSTSSTTQFAFTTYCSKVDPLFAALIRPSSTPRYPNNILQPVFFVDNDAMDSYLADTLYSFSVTILSNARVFDLKIASFKSSSGRVVNPSSFAMALNILELGSQGYVPGTYRYDLTAPASQSAWPILSMTYLRIDRQRVIQTCASKKSLIQFFKYFYTSPLVNVFADDLSVGRIPDLLVDAFDIVSQLESVTCLSNRLFSGDVGVSGYLASSHIAARLLLLLTTDYKNIDPIYTPKQQLLTTEQIYAGVVLNEIDVGIVNPIMLPSDVDNVDIRFIPAFATAVVPIFNLPDQLMQLYTLQKQTDNPLGLPPLFPLLLSVECAAALYLGLISQWNDTRIIELNPQLTPWLQHSNADVNIQLIVGISTSFTSNAVNFNLDKILINSFRFHLSKLPSTPDIELLLDIIKRIIDTDYPFDTLQKLPTTRVRMSVLDTEARFETSCRSKSGSVSYQQMMSTNSDDTHQFQMTRNDKKVPSNYDSVKQCGIKLHSAFNPAMMNDVSILQNWMDEKYSDEGCYPFTALLIFVINANIFSSEKGSFEASCTRFQSSFELVNYIQSSTLLSSSIQSLGFYQLSSLPSSILDLFTRATLYEATCAGQPLLTISPQTWSVNGGIQAFGNTMGAIGILAAIMTTFVFLRNHHKDCVEAMSFISWFCVLFGVALLSASLFLWCTNAVSAASCIIFQWFANLGWTMILAPLTINYCHTYTQMQVDNMKANRAASSFLQVYLRYSSPHIQLAVLVTMDILILVVWSSMSPLQPIEGLIESNGSPLFYTTCDVTAEGNSFLITQVVFKLSLLLVGIVMAIHSRALFTVHQQFYGSKIIFQSISKIFYYFGALTLAVTLLLYFIGSSRDQLILFVTLYIALIMVCVWYLLFFRYFKVAYYVFFSSSNNSLVGSRASGSLYSGSTGHNYTAFTDRDLTALNNTQLLAYFHDLKNHIQQVGNKLGKNVTLIIQDANANNNNNVNTNGFSKLDKSNLNNNNSNHNLSSLPTTDSLPFSIGDHLMIQMPPKPTPPTQSMTCSEVHDPLQPDADAADTNPIKSNEAAQAIVNCYTPNSVTFGEDGYTTRANSASPLTASINASAANNNYNNGSPKTSTPLLTKRSIVRTTTRVHAQLNQKNS